MIPALVSSTLFLVGYVVFKVHMNDWLTVSLLLIGTSFAATGLGMLLVSLVRTRAQITPVVSLVVLVTSAIGGAWWPLFLEPTWMQQLASDVGGLQRVLTNVKTRGGWSEWQLGVLLEEMLTPEQFAKNMKTRDDTDERVEFAIKLPGDENGAPVWLPIDAKFPMEHYERLTTAQENGDSTLVEAAMKTLETQLKRCAKDICEKYINPPKTTDFALLFLPSEGLYAEAIRRVGLVQNVQRDCRVTFVGPTTLAALLNSLQMGFRTLAIQRRSSEVWNLLATVKTEFGKFGDALSAVKEKIDQASRKMEDVDVRSRVITKKLRDVEELPSNPQPMLSNLLPGEDDDGRAE